MPQHVQKSVSKPYETMDNPNSVPTELINDYNNAFRSGPRMSISVEFIFEAAHYLPNHDGKCRNLHGHSYKLQVEVSGRVLHDEGSPKDGMVIDFGPLKDQIKKEVWSQLDHKCINNDLPEIGTPTAENIVFWVFNVIQYRIIPNSAEIVLEAVRLWETATTMVEMRR